MLENKSYLSTIYKILKLSGEKLCPKVTMMEKQLAKENIKQSEETVASILSFLQAYEDEVVEFSVIKLGLISNEEEIDEDDDYYPDDDDDEEEEEENGLSQTFLIDYIIELLLIKRGREHLELYLKKLRIPNSKKYAKELIDIYESIQSLEDE